MNSARAVKKLPCGWTIAQLSFVRSHFSISSARTSFYKFSGVLSFQKDKTYVNNTVKNISRNCLQMISQDPLTQHKFFCHISAVLDMSLETHRSSWQPNVAQCYYLVCLQAMSGITLQQFTLQKSFSWQKQINWSVASSPLKAVVNTSNCLCTMLRTCQQFFPTQTFGGLTISWT